MCFREGVESGWCVSERVFSLIGFECVSERLLVGFSVGFGCWCVSERVLSVVGVFQRGCRV